VNEFYLSESGPCPVPHASAWGSAQDLVGFIVESVRHGRSLETPFLHATFRNIFPESIYAAMLAAMPDTADYRAMSGRSREAKLQDGTPTRYKIDLFPEYIRHLPAHKRGIWSLVGNALRSPKVRSAFVARLAAGLERRFGSEGPRIGLYPVPVLTGDVAGYWIALTRTPTGRPSRCRSICRLMLR
jgi:hypothetical protein